MGPRIRTFGVFGENQIQELEKNVACPSVSTEYIEFSKSYLGIGVSLERVFVVRHRACRPQGFAYPV